MCENANDCVENEQSEYLNQFKNGKFAPKINFGEWFIIFDG